uniref:Putative photolyase-cryptochrome n=1 Tax=Lampea lactea TaxID=1403706 RepID=A0A1S6WNH3_9METZ|nr:putative photolyase-cryptochrome [Lampea lactea]
MSGVALHWFRKGIRLHDNVPLTKAIESCSTLIPIFILDTDFLDPKKVSANRLGFLLDSLKCLDEDLQERGSRLIVAKGKPSEVIFSLIEEFKINKLTFERGTEPFNKDLDDELIGIVNANDIEVYSNWGHILFNPDHILALNNGKTPVTMNVFLKLASSAPTPLKPIPAPEKIPPPPADFKPKNVEIFISTPTLSDLKEYGYDPEAMTTWFKAGEKEGIKIMEDFLKQKQRVASFEKPKTKPTALLPDTTALSPYLSVGSLSVRLFYHKLLEVLKSFKRHSKPPVSLEGQLYWRELTYLIGYSTPNFHQMRENPLCYQIPWTEGEAAQEALKKWEMGQTGYPAVDAAMNQLRSDGWMHHLARHLVACFLTRGDLWISWELGRDVFDKYLIDADWSINNFSWHWMSCSAFFYQFFRCYGPVSFFKKTDPNGDYIRKHVPILAKYPVKYIYEPWEAPKNVQEAAGCIIGQDYPRPIVEHKTVSQANMGKLKKAYDKNKADRAKPAKVNAEKLEKPLAKSKLR